MIPDYTAALPPSNVTPAISHRSSSKASTGSSVNWGPISASDNKPQMNEWKGNTCSSFTQQRPSSVQSTRAGTFPHNNHIMTSSHPHMTSSYMRSSDPYYSSVPESQQPLLPAKQNPSIMRDTFDPHPARDSFDEYATTYQYSYPSGKWGYL